MNGKTAKLIRKYRSVFPSLKKKTLYRSWKAMSQMERAMARVAYIQAIALSKVETVE